MTNDRNRVRKGVKEGGQFATEARHESGLELSRPKPDFDVSNLPEQLASHAWGRARKKQAEWSRTNRHRGAGQNAPAELLEELDDASRFTELPRERQAELLEPHMVPLLDEHQTFGSERIKLADSFAPDPQLTMLGLTAQKRMEDAGFPGDITFVSLERDRATFKIEDRGLAHDVVLADGHISYAPSNRGRGDVHQRAWRGRDTTIFHGSIYDDTGGTMKKTFAEHRAAALLSETMANSPMRAASEQITGTDFERSRVSLRRDEGPEFKLHLGTPGGPALTDGMGRRIDAETAATFLEGIARDTGSPSAGAFIGDLQRVFAVAREKLAD